MAYYFNKSSWTITPEPPGAEIPTVAVLPLAAVFGLLFVVFLPVMGFYLVGKQLLEVGAEGMASIARLISRKA